MRHDDETTVTVSMLIDWEDTNESVDFTMRVPKGWMVTEENLAAIYEAFRRDMILDIEEVCCEDCGETLEEDTIHNCDEEDDDE